MYYQLNPGTLSPVGTKSLVQTNTLRPEQALETALYLGDQFTVSQNFDEWGREV